MPPEYEGSLKDNDYPTAFPLHVLVNPVITPAADSKKAVYFEACLSIEGYFALVPRHNKIDVEAVDVDGNPISFTAEGWMARVMQHE